MLKSVKIAVFAVLVSAVWAFAGDRSIENEIKAELLDEDLTEVDVSVKGDRATLSGQTSNLWGKNKAEEIARDKDSIDEVVNRIEINGHDVDDERLLSRVRQRLVNYVHYSIYDLVNAGVKDGKVMLNGYVTAPYKSKEMAKMTSRIDGVKQVVNEIETLPASIKDEELRQEISRRIYGDTMFFEYSTRADPPIHILVKNGRVTLAGTVRSELEKQKAEQIARSTFGVMNVDNLLQVS